MIEDTVLREHRAQWTDMAARVPFTRSEEPVHDSRKHLEEVVYQEVRAKLEVTKRIQDSAKTLQNAADSFDVG